MAEESFQPGAAVRLTAGVTWEYFGLPAVAAQLAAVALKTEDRIGNFLLGRHQGSPFGFAFAGIVRDSCTWAALAGILHPRAYQTRLVSVGNSGILED